VLNFPITYVNKDIVWGLLCRGALNFPILLLSKFLTIIYFYHFKLNLDFMFALNFCIIYLFEFLVSVESMKSDEGSELNVCD
jgi:hypothetical protein